MNLTITDLNEIRNVIEQVVKPLQEEVTSLKLEVKKLSDTSVGAAPSVPEKKPDTPTS